MLLKNCRFIVTQNMERQILEKQDILIKDGIVAKIGQNLKKNGKSDPEIDCSGKIAMPGLINTHTHLGMHSLRGMNDRSELFDWLKTMEREEAKLDAKTVRENTLSGLREAIRFGTTTIYDSYKFPEERVEAFRKVGMRALVSSTVKDEKSFKDSAKFLRGIKNGLVRGAIAANAVYSCDEETLRKVTEYSEKNEILRRIHVGETRQDRFKTMQEKEKLAIEYLEQIGFLGERALLVHCIWITKGEIKKIAKAKTKVSHNPVSNMKLASGGVMPLNEMLEEKVIVGLGTDSVASNNNLDMFEEMKMCALLHRHHKWDANAITAQQALDMATINGAKCLGLEGIGSIEEGMKADIITLEIEENMKPANDLVSNIVFAANGLNVSDAIIDGKIKMENKKLSRF